MFHAVRAPTEGREDGFTIIEVLIALAIFALATVAIGQVVAANARGVRTLEDHVALVQSAQSVLATAIPPHEDLALGRLAGNFNDHRWQVDIGPVGDRSLTDNADAAWIPVLVRIHVQSSSGGAIRLETVRLMRGQTR